MDPPNWYSIQQWVSVLSLDQPKGGYRMVQNSLKKKLVREGN